ncbi:alpha/beta hydrolase [Piscinibacter gummiphilus]|uniref:Alpha/beta hydrolase n=1 Tax=Piscinibacter gummiphilus TaxID=946333 RepID=A0ABZ0CZC6_9BURK|nr:alpha/beta hydrolase [Piscinibacter gummiphilus]WOB08337.1 alpha/beta hydrolase [Piscinibacter gummiphilus]
MRGALLVGVWLWTGALQALAAGPAPCRVDGLSHQVLCGAVLRPLDPAAASGPQIAVHYVVVPALARNKLADPVFLLAGGPGQSAISLAGQVMPLFARLNNRRDIVFVDQRGTGRSAPLVCEDPRRQSVAEQADPERQLAQLRECRQRLQALPHGDLRHYTTPIAMQDLDAVRRTLGAERIDLVGVSYGTRAGLDYLRQFPAHVRRLVLDGVAPPDMALPASSAADAQTAFDALLTACEAEPACRREHPDLRGAWSAWLARLPQPVSVQHPLTGQPEQFTLTRAMAMSAVRGALYTPVLMQALPVAMHEATLGRPQGLLTLGSSLTGRKGSGLAMGMHFSVVCSEDLSRLVAGRDTVPGDFADGRTLYEKACADWPRGELPEAFYRIGTSPVPVLLLSGGLDPATPPRHGERVARALGAKARHVVVPNAGHGVLGIGCGPELLTRFVDHEEERAALALDTRCVQGVPRPPAFRPVGSLK